MIPRSRRKIRKYRAKTRFSRNCKTRPKAPKHTIQNALTEQYAELYPGQNIYGLNRAIF